MSLLKFRHLDQDLYLLPEKAVYWAQEAMMIISDLHFGKVQHFRKEGLAVPSAAVYKNWQKLFSLLNRSGLKQVVFLGDLFHSDWNHEWKDFSYLLEQFPELNFKLILGNHDKLDESWYQMSRLEALEEMELGPYHFSHEPQETEAYNLCGHIHPSVRLKGAGRQGIKLPCFYFGKKQGILPAFGQFTGTHKIKVKKDDQVFVISDKEVIQVSG